MRRTQAATADLNRRLKSIRDLWLAVHNDHNRTIGDQSVEFYYKIGELLEGKDIEKLVFKTIDGARVARQTKDG